MNSENRCILLPCLTTILFLALVSMAFARPLSDEPWTGPRVMKECFERHQRVPRLYEEQTMVLRDREGNREIRKARRFSRLEENSAFKILLIFDAPAEVRGVSLLIRGSVPGGGESSLYLPAFEKRLLPFEQADGGYGFLGTDFSLEDLMPEVMPRFRYARETDHKIDLIPCYVVEAVPLDMAAERATAYGLRRLFLRKDNLFIIRIDYYDRSGRFFKRQTFHDLMRVDGDMWQANMAVMEDFREKHETLIKVDRRVISNDYVPAELFAPAWLLQNRHIWSPEKRLFQKEPQSPQSSEPGPQGPTTGLRARE